MGEGERDRERERGRLQEVRKKGNYIKLYSIRASIFGTAKMLHCDRNFITLCAQLSYDFTEHNWQLLTASHTHTHTNLHSASTLLIKSARWLGRELPLRGLPEMVEER